MLFIVFIVSRLLLVCGWVLRLSWDYFRFGLFVVFACFVILDLNFAA